MFRTRKRKAIRTLYSSRPHVYYPQTYYIGRFLTAFIKMCVAAGNTSAQTKPSYRQHTRRSTIITLIIYFFVLPSLPICYALYRNYRWEMDQPPTAVVPNLFGLDLKTSTECARSVHLNTRILGQTWYTNLPPGRITVQSPEPGQRVPFETVIGLEFAVNPPAALADLKGNTP
ncbi:MAG: hypothetical protein DMF69_25075 [Acidobacteria bacterium]|nr:MAG: hypothetical protein DMF69_25075 [Acidobacteriota bacterium]